MPNGQIYFSRPRKKIKSQIRVIWPQKGQTGNPVDRQKTGSSSSDLYITAWSDISLACPALGYQLIKKRFRIKIIELIKINGKFSPKYGKKCSCVIL